MTGKGIYGVWLTETYRSQTHTDIHSGDNELHIRVKTHTHANTQFRRSEKSLMWSLQEIAAKSPSTRTLMTSTTKRRIV